MDNIEIIVRVLPSGDQVTLALDQYTSGKDIKQVLIDQDIAPSLDSESKRIIYKLISKTSTQEIGDQETLDDAKIKAGEELLMVPDMVAG